MHGVSLLPPLLPLLAAAPFSNSYVLFSDRLCLTLQVKSRLSVILNNINTYSRVHHQL